ncbi:MAG: hypothetical protein H0W30_16750 [Gemmatimonadaceae bacterium]|nr:hypothetical protein [Gemmatimonadaceae bacterium]
MKKQLWLRLKQYHFDDLVPPQLSDHVRKIFGGTDPSTQAFASKLARKLGWTSAFSLRAIEEYRKFVYLGMVSERSVTPPKVIDQVWHEHLLFSRPYREFCRDVLKRDFDHNPELVPSERQTEAFHAQYDATLELYRDEFNMTPPADIWGTPKFMTKDPRIQMPKPKKKSSDTGVISSGGDAPLYLHFDGRGADGGVSDDAMPEFGGGGAFSGAGGGSSWGDASNSIQGADTGSSGDAGDGGGGSSCSSSCGGGGE